LGLLIDPSPDEDRLDITYYMITGTAGAVRGSWVVCSWKI